MSSPTTETFPQSVRPLSDAFNALYGLVYVTMGDLFSGEHDQGERIGRLYTLMSDALSPVARQLVQIPIDEGQNACPTFEIYRFTKDPWEETAEMLEQVVSTHPELADAATRVRSFCA
jgi:hypothetical protein